MIISSHLSLNILNRLFFGWASILLVMMCANLALADNHYPLKEKAAAYYEQGRFLDALKIWERLADEGYAEAQFNLSLLYLNGRGTDPNKEKAEKYLKQAANQGYAPALHNMALYLTESDKLDEAQDYLIKAVSLEFPSSLYTLGKFYQAGLIGPEKPGLAFRYVSRAADLGHTKAQYNLGKMYRDGYGVTPNDILSTAWLLRAANQGHSSAQFKLVGRYGDGVGVPRDAVQAMKWFLISEKSGIPEILKQSLNSDQKTKAKKAAKLFIAKKEQK